MPGGRFYLSDHSVAVVAEEWGGREWPKRTMDARSRRAESGLAGYCHAWPRLASAQAGELPSVDRSSTGRWRWRSDGVGLLSVTAAAGKNIWDTVLPFAPLMMPVAVTTSAFLALIGVILTMRQKARYDDWWNRFQWAMNAALDEDVVKKELGAQLLEDLAHEARGGRDKQVTKRTLEIVKRHAQLQLLEVEAQLATRRNPGDTAVEEAE